jgi:hypothetical protein
LPDPQQHYLPTKLVWSPQSNLRLCGQTTRAAHALSLGIPVGLGSDWLTCGSPSLLAELKVVRRVLRMQGVSRTPKQLAVSPGRWRDRQSGDCGARAGLLPLAPPRVSNQGSSGLETTHRRGFISRCAYDLWPGPSAQAAPSSQGSRKGRSLPGTRRCPAGSAWPPSSRRPGRSLFCMLYARSFPSSPASGSAPPPPEAPGSSRRPFRCPPAPSSGSGPYDLSRRGRLPSRRPLCSWRSA